MADFDNIIGNESITEHLINSINLNKVSHAYIISGDDDSGKSMFAASFAKMLLCTGEESPCGTCKSCIQADSGNNPDIIWVRHEKPNTISVDDVRRQVVGDSQIKPYAGKYKIYIIDEAEKLNQQAQNALLKTIEEPPAYVVVIFLTNNTGIFLPTIISRCVQLNIKPVKDSVIKKYLMDKYMVPDYRADICVAFAQGNVGKAVNFAKNEEFDNAKNEAIHLVKYIDDMEIDEIIDAIKRIEEFKLKVNDFIDVLMMWYRDVLLFKVTSDANSIIFKDEVRYIRTQASKHSYNGIENILNAMDKAKVRLNANVNFQLTLELMILTIKEN